MYIDIMTVVEADNFIVLQGNIVQYAEQILKKISNTFDRTYSGLTSIPQRFRIYFFPNPSSKGVESTS